MAYSGEACRNSTEEVPGGTAAAGAGSSCTAAQWMCTSLTGAFTSSGVSTSSTPRAAKNSRVRASSAARSLSRSREALGRQSPPRVM